MAKSPTHITVTVPITGTFTITMPIEYRKDGDEALLDEVKAHFADGTTDGEVEWGISTVTADLMEVEEVCLHEWKTTKVGLSTIFESCELCSSSRARGMTWEEKEQHADY